MKTDAKMELLGLVFSIASHVDDVLRQGGYTSSQFFVLRRLNLARDSQDAPKLISQSSLASNPETPKASNLSLLLQGMAKQRLVTQTRDKDNKRVSLVSITEKGERELALMNKILAQSFNNTACVLLPDALSTLSKFENALVRNVTLDAKAPIMRGPAGVAKPPKDKKEEEEQQKRETSWYL